MTTRTSIHIGKIIQNARFFNTQQWQGAQTTMDDLLQAVNNLFSLLEQRKMKYVLVGGIALLQYIQGRNTEDIDLILNVTALRKLQEITITSKSEYFARGIYQNLQIDFLLTKNPLFAHVQKHHTTLQPFFERTITSATVKGLLLLKLYALPSLYRQGDFVRVGLYENDVATLMFYHNPNMQEISVELTPYVSNQDLTAIQDIILDLTQRISRFQRNKEQE
ncbi:hypothetical protein [Candidatus Chloroploca asiatica]|uniref:Nucleotidyl transferase AbiEii/AbiGii toxin family protein n=1 Tax=Candidatus Chloroploca asiatica TaxID=1506545 RepID=A0A2H3KQT0_9CHLR|nr:hypothetical protein [Candidatus Chloroploca asiatica]PDV97536.1 hypothetical protein A9Q02_17940 [Candidatus Chloroploca asiatica]